MYMFREDWLAVGDLLREGKTQEGVAAARRIVDANPQDAGEWWTLAHKLERGGERTLAIEAALRALEFHPNQLERYTFPCLLLVRAGQYGRALELAQTGLLAADGEPAVRAMNVESLTFLSARSLYELGRLEEAKHLAMGLIPKFAMMVPKAEPLMSRDQLLAAIRRAGKGYGAV